MNDKQVKIMIQNHESCSFKVYLDSLGNPTVGFGHHLYVGSTINYKIAKELFEMDWDETVKAYYSLNLLLDPVRRAVVLDMIFNMGLQGFKTFKKMIVALRHGNYQKAANEMIDSQWYEQVGYRAKKLVEMMRSGEAP